MTEIFRTSGFEISRAWTTVLSRITLKDLGTPIDLNPFSRSSTRTLFGPFVLVLAVLAGVSGGESSATPPLTETVKKKRFYDRQQQHDYWIDRSNTKLRY